LSFNNSTSFLNGLNVANTLFILEWFKNYPDFKPVFSTDEITKAVQRAISLGEEEIRSLIARGKKKTEELFYPATEETLKAFLT